MDVWMDSSWLGGSSRRGKNRHQEGQPASRGGEDSAAGGVPTEETAVLRLVAFQTSFCLHLRPTGALELRLIIGMNDHVSSNLGTILGCVVTAVWMKGAIVQSSGWISDQLPSDFQSLRSSVLLSFGGRGCAASCLFVWRCTAISR